MIVAPDFFNHWKTRMLINMLGGDKSAPLYVLRLWAHCQISRKWVFENLSPAALKALCDFDGHPTKLDTALVTSGFVRRDDRFLTALSWDEYNAGLIANWDNGAKGGRPPKNPTETHGLSMGNPPETHREPSRLEQHRAEKRNTKPKQASTPEEIPRPERACLPAESHSQERVCSLLLALRSHGGGSVFEPKSAAAIARNPKASVEQVAWSIERFTAEIKTEAGRSRIKSPAAWIRHLIEGEAAPASWTEKFRRSELVRIVSTQGAPQ